MNLVNDMLSRQKNSLSQCYNRLHIDTDMDEEFAVDDYIVMEAYRILDPLHTQKFSNKDFSKTSTAQLKKQWGQKFNQI